MESRRDFFRKTLVSGAALWTGLKAPLFAQDQKPDAPAPKEVDVTAEWAKLHADPKAQPGTQYRAGRAKPGSTTPKFEKTAGGYSIQMPSGAPVPTPAVYKDRVFVSAGFHSKQYFCFEAASGKAVWGVDLDDDGPSTAACEDDVVVVNTESCTIFTLDASTGKQLWALWLGDPLMTAPTIAKGRVFTSFPANGRAHHKEATHLIGAFDLKSGKVLWQRWIDGDAISAPVAVGDEVLLATFTGTVFRFNQETGGLLSAVKARATSAPIVTGDQLHFSKRSEQAGNARESLAIWEKGGVASGGGGSGGRFGKVYIPKDSDYLNDKVQGAAELKKQGEKLDAGNGFSSGAPATANATAASKVVGQSNVATLQSFQGSRILRYGEHNFSCMGDELICADPRDGNKLWSVKLKGDLAKSGGFLGAPPVAAGGSIFMTTLAGAVLQIDPKSGETRKSWEVGRPMRFQPSVDGGRIFLGTHDGRMISIETGDPKATGWPQWGGNAQRTGVAAGS
jgi:outer membrane protein assembly factor BamB